MSAVDACVSWSSTVRLYFFNDWSTSFEMILFVRRSAADAALGSLRSLSVSWLKRLSRSVAGRTSSGTLPTALIRALSSSMISLFGIVASFTVAASELELEQAEPSRANTNRSATARRMEIVFTSGQPRSVGGRRPQPGLVGRGRAQGGTGP